MPIISVSHIIIIIQFDEEDSSILPYHDVFYVVLSDKTKKIYAWAISFIIVTRLKVYKC